MRTETDFLGEVQVDDTCLYGIQTVRARENFALAYPVVDEKLIKAIVLIKKAAANTYLDLQIGSREVYQVVMTSCDEILSGQHEEAFVTCALQGGAGTSMNMNVNEVLANLAMKKLGLPLGSYNIVHPLDVLNRGQSTNDVVPTALRIAGIQMLRELSEQCAKLQESLQEKEQEFEKIAKLGRTELMDAVPITLGQEFASYAQAISRDRWRLYKVEERLRQVNLGGTAVGTGTNADKKYRYRILEHLREYTEIGLAPSEYPMDITQNADVFVEVSGLCKALAVNLMKIANDFRLLSSGPNGGLGELRLKPLQMGSTIMPGKVNPVIPEMVVQTSIKVMSNDFAITMAAAHGELELNAFLPLIADSLLGSLHLLTQSVSLFRRKCVEVVEADEKRCKEHLDKSYAFATQAAKTLGYDEVARVVRETQGDLEKAKNQLFPDSF